MGQNILKRHAALVDRMATTLGVDLEEATMRGDMPMDDLAEVVLRCTGCSNPDGCTSWLGDHATSGAEHAPGYCRNASMLEGLRVEG